MTTNTDTTAASGAASRTPTDYALEFAEYLARGAEHLIEAVCADAQVRLRIAESDDVDDATEHDAQASVDEALRSLRDRIAEFRSRRDRAARASPDAQEAEPAGYRISDPEEPEIGSWFSETPARAKYGLLSVPLYAHPPHPQANAGAVPQGAEQVGEDGWPKLVKPARNGAVLFGQDVSARLLVECCYHLAEIEAAPQAPAAAAAEFPAVPPWLAKLVGEYGVAGGRDPNMESCNAWGCLIRGINRWVREAIEADRAARSAQAPAAGAAPTDARWWRKRADEIELAVARSGSPEAMRYYTDMRTLLQAVSLRAAAPAQEDGAA